MKRKPAKKQVKRVGTPKKRTETVASLSKKAQVVFNKYIRQRDSSNGYFVCISCGKDYPVSKMNAGHYVPVKNSSLLRFDEWNVNGECISCNLFDQFHLIGYRKRLVEKVGAQTVDWLESQARVSYKWARHELEEIIQKYGKRRT